MSAAPRVVLGVPTYNGSEHLSEALESLLLQDYPEFALVVVDDCSHDATPELAQAYASRDSRIHFERNPKRIGMVRNWRRVFERARELHPSIEYFAWGSDHDMWHPRFLGELVRTLDAAPEAVMAHPFAVGVNDVGQPIQQPPPFETGGCSNVWLRCIRTWRGMSAGFMVYGLFRAEALAACGVYHRVAEPDRLLLFELAAHGTCVQVPQVLWYRRRGASKPTRARQYASFFPEGRPVHTLLPLWVTQTGILMRSLVWRGSARPHLSRGGGLAASALYLCLSSTLAVRRFVVIRAKGGDPLAASVLDTWKIVRTGRPPEERQKAADRMRARLGRILRAGRQIGSNLGGSRLRKLRRVMVARAPLKAPVTKTSPSPMPSPLTAATGHDDSEKG